ncbi:MAG: DUF1573 domain-containing protein [Planctomycetaceae bacterium]|nr:DUF1573 domain-containing protein [Planctomycetaceae bacterium]
MQSHLKFRVAAICGGVAILTALAVGFCADGAAAVPAVEVAGPSGEYDFGYMEPSSKRKVVFIIKNTLDRPLTIKDIKRECDCTAISLKTPATVAPGQTLAVDVNFTAPKDRTNYVTRVMLFTDDPARIILPLTLRATVGLPLTFVPRRVNLGTLKGGQKVQQTVALANGAKSAVAIKDCTVKGPLCKAATAAAKVPPGGKTELTFTLEVASAPRNYEIRICVETDSADQPQACLSVEYTVGGGSGK